MIITINTDTSLKLTHLEPTFERLKYETKSRPLSSAEKTQRSCFEIVQT